MDTGLKLFINSLKTATSPAPVNRKSFKIFQLSLKKIAKNLSIRQKIGFSLGLAIGFVMVGTMAGRSVENRDTQQPKYSIENRLLCRSNQPGIYDYSQQCN